MKNKKSKNIINLSKFSYVITKILVILFVILISLNMISFSISSIYKNISNNENQNTTQMVENKNSTQMVSSSSPYGSTPIIEEEAEIKVSTEYGLTTNDETGRIRMRIKWGAYLMGTDQLVDIRLIQSPPLLAVSYDIYRPSTWHDVAWIGKDWNDVRENHGVIDLIDGEPFPEAIKDNQLPVVGVPDDFDPTKPAEPYSSDEHPIIVTLVPGQINVVSKIQLWMYPPSELNVINDPSISKPQYLSGGKEPDAVPVFIYVKPDVIKIIKVKNALNIILFILVIILSIILLILIITRLINTQKLKKLDNLTEEQYNKRESMRMKIFDKWNILKKDGNSEIDDYLLGIKIREIFGVGPSVEAYFIKNNYLTIEKISKIDIKDVEWEFINNFPTLKNAKFSWKINKINEIITEAQYVIGELKKKNRK